ncbi:Ribosomal protein 63, mitochondrial [Chionoecetes opilio]|uniref:Ribosomal protein 63, mitochondrial n=1 Tax=Chionoecetes opilio TaxID=41210 RepID=A0A8J4XLI7_CHIOP|nr:Ribosomal protein 63, mitochondrial [Chionoecetes opilio]
MRLTLALLRKRMPKGHIYLGKHRKIPKVTEVVTGNLGRRLEVEEQNMYILRHPYLTLEQAWGHGAALGKGKQFYERVRNHKEKWLTSVTVEEQYDTLRNNDKWD